MDWKPIETIPRDGTPVLIWDGKMMCVATFTIHKRNDGSEFTSWHGVGESGYDSDIDFDSDKVSHWAELPAPPAEGGV